LRGTFQLQRGIYIAEIPGGGALEPEKHLYEKEIFVLQGRGVTQVWQGDGEKLTFEWNAGSVFAIPPNTTHRLFNAGEDPVICMAVTTAPEVINALRDLDFVFNSDYAFADLYGDNGTYLRTSDLRTSEGRVGQTVWHTNFIPDVHAAALNDLEQKVAGGQLTNYRMGDAFPHGHISAWPAGRYHKAHYHGPGAILLGLDGEGYVLAWDSALGPRPYASGHGDEVIRVEWRQNSIYSPPNGYFHQHFNSGPTPARHIAVYGAKLPLGVHELYDGDQWIGMLSERDGGTLIDYEDEDPQIRRDFEQTVAAQGIACTMPAFAYR
jgi:oxalate decarboxylase/phosphoglucose isomerase-like protein (cupin superfamily)